ncbi:RNA polymerase RpoE-like sigma-24 subunit [Desulfitobacterium sp. LBE]|uniref:RNA polymerase subunit sigma-24 n=5 Tax=root TaxID=1 RepID=Q24XW4_DESHY|nr:MULTISPECIES: RNA polymerase sigma factor [Desulfitobacterium]ACL20495.1 RNA polymerase, sigma-24 subunit, ECF subfamily [Desulfitobacterium hafniense DCB-2]EHL04309.1 Sigma-70 region 2 [Desulfitobacterium hafniense DP7]KTE92379.1 RNA polymerase subunit sigma-24 [Desulfitobacterium hafniense]MEA5025992.1 RNA polymerase sigma factor [Desulfitobacterium hafniense]TWH56683.1 RNA polymerase RpoE-like sigma-24 subunit [Desulfitobacterium sp. LBE]
MADSVMQKVYEQHKDAVYAYLLSLTHSKTLSEDLTSEVFISAIKSLPGFKGNSDLKTWLFSIARYTWYGHLRKSKKELTPEDLLEVYFSDPAGLESTLLTQELLDRIHDLLNREPDKNRDIVLMRIEGYSFYEIARKHQISESSARVLDFRTKHKIRTILLKEGYSYE